MLARPLTWGQTQNRPRPDDGAVAVEFALVLPVLVMLVFGIVSAGQVYSDHLSITNAVRESSRFGSALDSTDEAVWAASVKERVRQVYMNGLGTLSPDQICVSLVDDDDRQVGAAAALGGNCGTEPDAPSSMSAGSCAVKVWVNKPAEISIMMIPAMQFTIGAQSVSFYGRETDSCSVI